MQKPVARNCNTDSEQSEPQEKTGDSTKIETSIWYPGATAGRVTVIPVDATTANLVPAFLHALGLTGKMGTWQLDLRANDGERHILAAFDCPGRLLREHGGGKLYLLPIVAAG